MSSVAQSSFRDPQGRTWIGEDVVLRGGWSKPNPGDEDSLSLALKPLQAAGKWVSAVAVDPERIRPLLAEGEQLPLAAWEHPRVFFPSYAHEWSPRMLHSAAALTLEVTGELNRFGWELKDATPTNILFEGPVPLFVDHFSPVRRNEEQLGWVAYGQFVRTFLVPLCLNRFNGLPLAWIQLACRDGVSPDIALSQLRLRDRFRVSVFTTITLPYFLSRWQQKTATASPGAWKGGDPSIGVAVTARILAGLRKTLDRWLPAQGVSHWTKYDHPGESYSARGLDAKDCFVRGALGFAGPRAVLDLGANTGRFSALAARAGARVVSVDGDPACVDRIWQRARAEGLDILPLVVDLGRPSPRLGWENGEELSFKDRVRGRFDMVFALALVHHLLVRERIPLPAIVDYLAGSTTRWAVVEWVPPEDPQFIRLSGPNRKLYETLTAADFETSLSRWFEIERTEVLPDGNRKIYLLRRKGGVCANP